MAVAPEELQLRVVREQASNQPCEVGCLEDASGPMATFDKVEKSALAEHEVAVLLPEGEHLDTATLHLLPKHTVQQAAVE